MKLHGRHRRTRPVALRPPIRTPGDLTPLQLICRGIVVLFTALVLVRIGAKRALASKTPFDLVLLVIVGSLLSRSINGSGPFLGSIAAAAVLVVLHRLLALLAYAWHPLGVAMKGSPAVVVENGRYILSAMRANHISQNDIQEDLRLRGKTETITDVRTARVERSGDISFIYRRNT